MKKLGLFSALVALLFAANAYACDTEKKDGKDKAPQAQTTTGAPVAQTPQAGK